MNTMKFIIAFFLTLSIDNICFSQADTIRVYAYLKPSDNWKLEVKNNKTYTLYNSLLRDNELTAKGRCIVTDTTFQFVCDTSKLVNKNLATDRLKQFSNIPFILTGAAFARQGPFFIPLNINSEIGDSIVIPNGIPGQYYKSDGYGSNIIELKGDNTYTFNDNSCMARYMEKGTWSVENGVVTFVPVEKKRSMLEWLADDRKFYLTNDYLVGKKLTRTYTKTHKVVVTETYSYLSKKA
jgi:hypothetical protein